MKRSLLILALAAATLTAGHAMAQTPQECVANTPAGLRVEGALARTDRPADAKAKDADRLSELNFVISHIKPGDHVLDFGAGSGYASMILSAAVCSGSVDSQNPPDWVSSPKAQAARDAMAAARPNIHLVTYPFDQVPVPAQPYDAIFIGTIYHDTYNEPGHDAIGMDKKLYAALKPGGIVIVTDHNTAKGLGVTETNSLHRIEKQAVLDDFKAAGFQLIEDSDVLANPADDHSLKVFDPKVRGHTDRMALVFKKPA